MNLKNYNTVCRMAKVGEKVLVCNSDSDAANRYTNGDVLTILKVDDDFAYYGEDWGEFLYPEEYYVLEPIVKTPSKKKVSREQLAREVIMNILQEKVYATDGFRPTKTVAFHFLTGKQNGYYSSYEPEINLQRKRRTLCVIKEVEKGNETAKVGVAYCHENDEYNKDIGMLVALCRATNTKIPDFV